VDSSAEIDTGFAIASSVAALLTGWAEHGTPSFVSTDWPDSPSEAS
jgi:hypothetical protein